MPFALAGHLVMNQPCGLYGPMWRYARLNLSGTGPSAPEPSVRGRQGSLDADRHRVLAVGAGSAGSMMLKDLLHSPSLGLFPVGVVDDDRRKIGRRLHGIPVIGTLSSIPRVVDRYQVSAVLLAIPSATDDLVRDWAGSGCRERRRGPGRR